MKTRAPRSVPLLAALLLGGSSLAAGVPDNPSTCAGGEPAALTAADYARAERFLGDHAEERVFGAEVDPEWIDQEDLFWYRNRFREGFEFVLVDAASGERRRAFDHARLAAALSRVSEEDYEPFALPFETFRFVEGRAAVEFEIDEERWRCELETDRCQGPLEPRPAVEDSILSPDGRLAAFTREHDLWVLDLESGEETRLTTDGKERHGYATDSQGWRRTDAPVLLWSPDSRRIATYRLDEREVETMHLLETALPRPILHSWPYAVPGDPALPMHQRVVLEVAGPSLITLDTEPDFQRTSSCCGLTRDDVWADVEWSADGEALAFVSTSRDYKTVTLRLADPVTGAVRTVLEESHPKLYSTNIRSGGVPNWRVLHGSGEFLWFSERDGWGHLYLYDLAKLRLTPTSTAVEINSGGSQTPLPLGCTSPLLPRPLAPPGARGAPAPSFAEHKSRLACPDESGGLRHPITEGAWNVLDVLRVDEEARRVYFTGVGREEGRDPYFRHLYSVGLDGSGLTLLTPEDADHEISFSPSGLHFVDAYSTPQSPPVAVVRRAEDGAVTGRIEEADISELLAIGWRPPTSFTVRARDGVTVLYGQMFQPSDFDPARSYPVVSWIYPGPQVGSIRTRSFEVDRRGAAHALAELGFIVVAVDALGTPLRSKAFHTFYYGDLGDNGLEDQKGAIEQLAARHPWIDLDRVGIFGHSGGGYATAGALLRYPDFFRVGVASAGNHDNRGYTDYWGERWHGLLEREESGTDDGTGDDGGEQSPGGNDEDGGDEATDNYQRQANPPLAGALRGRLLLSYGTMDPNVHPNLTLLLIDALVEHGHDFDLMVFPNRKHGYSGEPYNVRRTWDYFVTHLLGKRPPAGYRIAD